MKPILLLLVSFWFFSTAEAQELQTASKYWIFFKDKEDAAGKVARVESKYLTEAALNRRARRGVSILPERDNPLSTTYLQQIRALHIEPLVQSRWLNATSAVLTPGEVQVVQGLPFVTSVRAVARLQPLTEPASNLTLKTPLVSDIRQSYRLDYGASIGQLELVNAVLPLEEGLSGAGVKLGIIDTGMGDRPATHPSTDQLVTEGRFIASEDFTGQAPDASRHGHSVLSVAAGFDPGQLIGPAYGAQIYHARTEYAPSETNQEEDNFVAGIEWMETQGVEVVNISLGYSEFDNGQTSYTVADMDGNTGITTIAADMAVEMGMVVVTAAGNEGCSSPSACWYFITTPADGDDVIAVGAVTPAGDRVGFSSRGPTADGRIKPDVMAQGSSVYLASSGPYSNSSGTSFASPMIAGIVAMMLEANPELIPGQVIEILRSSADRASDPDNSFGWGIVDADAAVRMARDLIVTSTEEASARPVVGLEAPYPNPFIDHTTLLLRNDDVPVSARVVVYNSLGQAVVTAFDGLLATGRHRIAVDLSGLASGLYFYRFEAGDVTQSGSLVRL